MLCYVWRYVHCNCWQWIVHFLLVLLYCSPQHITLQFALRCVALRCVALRCVLFSTKTKKCSAPPGSLSTVGGTSARESQACNSVQSLLARKIVFLSKYRLELHLSFLFTWRLWECQLPGLCHEDWGALWGHDWPCLPAIMQGGNKWKCQQWQQQRLSTTTKNHDNNTKGRSTMRTGKSKPLPLWAASRILLPDSFPTSSSQAQNCWRPSLSPRQM